MLSIEERLELCDASLQHIDKHLVEIQNKLQSAKNIKQIQNIIKEFLIWKGKFNAETRVFDKLEAEFKESGYGY